MILIIPEREILKSFTDNNIDSDASKVRAKSFSEAHDLITYDYTPVEIIIAHHSGSKPKN